MSDEPLSHAPLHPPRSFEHNLGEHAYSDEWSLLMLTPLEEHQIEDDDDYRTGNLGIILTYLPVDITDRHSRIAAGFIRWLGTNCGRAISVEPRRRDGDRRHAKAWHVENRRIRGMNSGWRISDYLTSDDWDKPRLCRDAMELEVFDLIAAWLDSSGGQSFLQRAEARLRAYQGGLRNGQFIITAEYQVVASARVCA